MKSATLLLVCVYLVGVHSYSPTTFPFKSCVKQNGGWSVYLRWGPCSKSCGDGYQTRQRYCDNPIPKYGGAKCYGSSIQTRRCNIEPCQNVLPIKTIYTKCSRKCGGGYREKRQDCTFPQDADQSCFSCNADRNVVLERCNTHSCQASTPTYSSVYLSNDEFDDEKVSSYQSKRCVQDCLANKELCFQSHEVTTIFHKFKCIKAYNECQNQCKSGRKRETGDVEFVAESDEDFRQQILSAAKVILQMLRELCSASQSVKETNYCMQSFMKQIKGK